MLIRRATACGFNLPFREIARKIIPMNSLQARICWFCLALFSTAATQISWAAESAESAPSRDELREDLFRFVQATRSPRAAFNTTCATCPAMADAVEVLKPVGFDVTQLTCSGDRCDVAVTMRATFNQSTGQTISGGLVAWISQSQRDEWLHGKTPPGQQTFRVKATYVRRGEHWRAIEFAPDDGK